jgi:hypothetical protein
MAAYPQVEDRFHVAVGEEIRDGDGGAFRRAEAIAGFEIRGGPLRGCR